MQPDMIQPNNYRIDEAKYKSLLKYIRLSVTEKYEFPQEIVQIDGVTIATIGNFSASTGKPKSKKTFNVSAIVASALSGKEILKYKAETAILQESNPIHRHRTKQVPLPQSASSNPQTGRIAY